MDDGESFTLNNEKRIALVTAKKCGSTFSSSFLLTLEPEDFSNHSKEDRLPKWFLRRVETTSKKVDLSKKTHFVLYNRGYSGHKQRQRIGSESDEEDNGSDSDKTLEPYFQALEKKGGVFQACLTFREEFRRRRRRLVHISREGCELGA